jgi:hypothetical protein
MLIKTFYETQVKIKRWRNDNLDVKKRGCDGLRWIELAHVQWRPLVLEGKSSVSTTRQIELRSRFASYLGDPGFNLSQETGYSD